MEKLQFCYEYAKFKIFCRTRRLLSRFARDDMGEHWDEVHSDLYDTSASYQIRHGMTWSFQCLVSIKIQILK